MKPLDVQGKARTTRKKKPRRYTRREFLGMAGAAGLALVAGTPAMSATESTFDLVILGGRVIDPASKTDALYNIGIAKGKIAAMTREKVKGKRVIDAQNLVVSPGFIDVHSHADGIVTAGEHEARMGVTTLIGGNCGSSETVSMQNAKDLGVGAFLERIDREGYPVNHAFFVGASDIREKALGFGKYASVPVDALEKMGTIAQAAMDHGAIGISFGLEYSPGTTADELNALFALAKKRGAVCATHIRNSGRGLIGVLPSALSACEEVVAAARRTGAMLQISHLASQIAWRSDPYDDLTHRGLAVLHNAQQEGVQVLGDAHPYTAWCTDAGAAALDPFLKGKLMTWVMQKHFYIDIGMLEVGSGPYKGKLLTQELLEKLRKEAPLTPIIGHTMQSDLVEMIYKDPLVMVASDAVYDKVTGLPPHPRGCGTFPRVLQTMVREKRIITLSEALNKMTSMPAERFGLKSKGRIIAGADADITIFNPATVLDAATYADPAVDPQGIAYVIVGGTPVVDGGKLQHARPGKAVRLQA